MEGLQREEICNSLKQEISARSEIMFAYLFGSVATKKENTLSDIDLAIYLDPNYRHRKHGYSYESELISELSSLLTAPVDVIVLNRASTILKYQVIKNGVLIFSRCNKTRREFHEKTIRDYLDLKPLLEVQQQYLLQRFSNFSSGS